MRTQWRKAMTVTISGMVNALQHLCVMFPSCNRESIFAAAMVARPVMVQAVPSLCVEFSNCSQNSFVATPMVATPKDKLL